MSPTLRFLLIGALVLAAASVGWGSREAELQLPVYRPEWTTEQALAVWCSDGTLYRHGPRCERRTPGGGHHVLDGEHFSRYRRALPPRWPRLRSPHPAVYALALAGSALFLAWLTSPFALRIRANGLTLGGRFIQADELRDWRFEHVLRLPRLVLSTDRGEFRSRPLGLPTWELEELGLALDQLLLSAAEKRDADASRAALNPQMQALRPGGPAPRLRVGAHEVTARVRWLARTTRVALVALVLAMAAGLAVGGVHRSVTWPGFYRPERTHQQELEEWCGRGRLVVHAAGVECVRRNRVDRRSEFEAFREQLEPLWLRPRPPHRTTLAVIVAAFALVVWWVVGPVRIRVRANGVLIGRTFIQADDIRDVRAGMFLGRPRLELTTRQGRIRTPPLRIPPWELDVLCNQIRALVLDRREQRRAEALGADLEPKMRALGARRSRSC